MFDQHLTYRAKDYRPEAHAGYSNTAYRPPFIGKPFVTGCKGSNVGKSDTQTAQDSVKNIQVNHIRGETREEEPQAQEGAADYGDFFRSYSILDNSSGNGPYSEKEDDKGKNKVKRGGKRFRSNILMLGQNYCQGIPVDAPRVDGADAGNNQHRTHNCKPAVHNFLLSHLSSSPIYVHNLYPKIGVI